MANRMILVKSKAGELDSRWCVRLNLWTHDTPKLLFFRLISRLGDGIFWYCLMAAFPLLMGPQGFGIAAIMILMACWGVFLYRQIKLRSMRPRPFKTYGYITQGARTLDEFSFPSGHTMHAVAFTVLMSGICPWLLWFLVPFTLLTGLARVVLGLHYPSDVMFGALLGALNGALFLGLYNLLVWA